MTIQDQKTPEYYMRKALAQAAVSAKKGEVPIGAVVVDAQGAVIARGHNRMESVGCQTAHAEMSALEKACRVYGDWRLDKCTLYVTLEPCLMCFGLIHLSRIKKVYYAASSPLFGYAQAVRNDKATQSAYARSIEVISGVLEQESVALLQAFFKDARGKNKEIYYEAKKSGT